MSTAEDRAAALDLVARLTSSYPELPDAPPPDLLDHARLWAYLKTDHDVGGEPAAAITYENKQYEVWEHNTYVICEVLAWRGIWLSEERRRIGNVDLGRTRYLAPPGALGVRVRPARRRRGAGARFQSEAPVHGAAEYGVTNPLPPWKTSLDGLCDALDHARCAPGGLDVQTRRYDEDALSATIYPTLPLPREPARRPGALPRGTRHRRRTRTRRAQPIDSGNATGLGGTCP